MSAKSAKKYLAAADILRVFAIFAVAWYHIWQQSWLDPGFRIGSFYVNLQQVVRHGYLMVDVLLVISGFLLAIPYARAFLGRGPHPDAREFYVKRFWRIVPSYMLGIVLCLFLFALPEGAYSSPEFMVKDLLAHLTFTHNLFYDTYFATPLQIVLWTMGVEVQFYLLFPFFALLYEHRPRMTCLTMAVIAFACRVWAWQQESLNFWINQLPMMLDLYACGMLAALLHERLAARKLRPKHRWAAALGALVCLLLLIQFLYWQPVAEYDKIRRYQLLFRLPVGIASGGFLLLGGLSPAGLSRALGNPLTRFLSAVSYNFYIWHQTLAVELKKAHIPSYTAENPSMAGEQPWQNRYTLLCFAAALAAAALLTYLWERPVNKWGLRKRKVSRDRPRDTDAVYNQTARKMIK